jgi:hypothetical protein
MKLYFAVTTKDDFEPVESISQKNILLSFFYYKGAVKEYIDSHKSLYDNILIDSGAFSFFNSGKDILLTDYEIAIKESNFQHYFNLDVIGNAEGSYQNYLRMLENGLNPIPVFHADTPIEYLQKYMERTDFIAVGGLVGNNNIESNLNGIFSEINKINPAVKVHGLGLTKVSIIKNYPFYSVDSSSYCAITKFARASRWTGTGFKSIDTFEYFQRYGIKFKDQSTSGYRYFLIQWQMNQYLQMIDYVNEYRDNKGLDNYLNQTRLFD